MRMTIPLVAAAHILAAAPDTAHYSYDLIKRTGLNSGVINSLLKRLYANGWITDTTTPADAPEPGIGRPARRYFAVTQLGREEFAGVVERAGGDARFRHLHATTTEA